MIMACVVPHDIVALWEDTLPRSLFLQEHCTCGSVSMRSDNRTPHQLMTAWRHLRARREAPQGHISKLRFVSSNGKAHAISIVQVMQCMRDVFHLNFYITLS